MALTYESVLPLSETSSFEESLREFGRRSIRLHYRRLNRFLPFASTPIPWYPAGRFLEDSKIRPSTFLQYAIGDYYIQDAGSMLPIALIDWNAEIANGPWVCDLCAAPGGKASAITERLGPYGFLVANEPVQSRIDVLKYALARTGTPNYAVTRHDPDTLAASLPNFFDTVLVDAPCSGQTLVGRDKRSENAFSDKQIAHCALRQKRILASALTILKPGGTLIYSTCTFAIEENEAQIEWLLEHFPDCVRPIQRMELSQWQSPRTPGCYRLWPHRDSCAGGFAAALQKCADTRIELSAQAATHPNPEACIKPFKKPSKKSLHADNRRQANQEQEIRDTLLEVGTVRSLPLAVVGNSLVARSEVDSEKIQRVRSIGGELAPLLVASGTHVVPTQALAMLDGCFFEPNQVLDLNDADAKLFLQGQAIPKRNGDLDSMISNRSGWTLAKWQDRGLGWLKGIEKRYNNHLPPWARS
jgi:16S rRNA C967 or C1407 C5-methylase (RsmB/RsmF family)